MSNNADTNTQTTEDSGLCITSAYIALRGLN